MAEVSAISWTDATFNPCLRDEGIAPKLRLVRQLMASDTKRHAVSHVKSQFRKLSEWPDVMSIEISALIITAMTARKFVTEKYVVSPLLQFGRQALAASLDALPVDITRRVWASRRALSRLSANFGACFKGMLLSDPIAWTSKSGGPHFGSALL